MGASYRALWNGVPLAESDETIYIEGNQYFPQSSVNTEYLRHSDTTTTCPWKGEANYYDVVVGRKENKDAAWYYEVPKPSAIKTVGKDFSGYVAFWRGVVVEKN